MQASGQNVHIAKQESTAEQESLKQSVSEQQLGWSSKEDLSSLLNTYKRTTMNNNLMCEGSYNWD